MKERMEGQRETEREKETATERRKKTKGEREAERIKKNAALVLSTI
jgi:hypothetical protein